ncbi:ABC transporter permease [Lactobacillus johnsonii]|uniref:ABC transporter permease n=1 Tax=Lactobacillus johnsonii TaxID=33959 RepID=UPI00261C5B3C|nr:ABC transporter permease [Lactobacillus johnsonii]MDT9605718.1 ABC transporter permease [Lactobacillus johnsonii]
MTTFKALFNQMGKKKRRSVYLLALLQLVAASIFALWGFFSNGGFSNSDMPIGWFAMVCTFAPLADMAYVVLSAWQNEKEYSSQTWRLVPISSSKFYLANISSAIVNGLYLVLIQIGMGIVTFLPAFLSKDVRTSIWEINRALSKETHAGDFWQKFSDSFPIGEILSAFLAFLLFAILVYSIVTLLNLSSRTITDFLPDKHSKLIRFVIMIILIFILIVLTNNLGSLLNQVRWGETRNSLVGFAESNLMMAFIDIVLGSINVWLLKNFHEGK